MSLQTQVSKERSHLVPRVLRHIGDDLVFIYKPPFWDCTTSDTRRVRPWKSLEDMEDYLSRHDLSDYRTAKPQIYWWLQVQFPGENIFSRSDSGFGLCHRLDRQTSGVLIVARTEAKYGAIRDLFHRKKVAKLYLTLLAGRVHAHDERGVRLFSKVDVAKDADQVTTHVHVLGYAEPVHDGTCSLSLCAVEIREGRTHQIRKHVTRLMTHIVGEFEGNYVDPANLGEDLVDRVFLHSYAIALPLGIGDETTYLYQICPLPGDLRDALQRLKSCDLRDSGSGEFVKTSIYLSDEEPSSVLQRLGSSGFISNEHEKRMRGGGRILDSSVPSEQNFMLDLFPWRSSEILGLDWNDMKTQSVVKDGMTDERIDARRRLKPPETGLEERAQAHKNRGWPLSSRREAGEWLWSPGQGRQTIPQKPTPLEYRDTSKKLRNTIEREREGTGRRHRKRGRSRRRSLRINRTRKPKVAASRRSRPESSVSSDSRDSYDSYASYDSYDSYYSDNSDQSYDSN